MSKANWREAARHCIPDPRDPSLKGELKRLAGSRSDDFNNLIVNQTLNTLWLAHSDKNAQTNQFIAVSMALAGIGPRDELEGMLAAQLVATHQAAMECYRRAMLPEQPSEGRQENQSASKMPAFKEKLTRQEIESLVPVVKDFRGANSQENLAPKDPK